MNVAENLYEFLKKNDRAELIGFGTFYVTYNPAKLNSVTRTLNPPSKTISFKTELNDDMSFVQSMSKDEFISLETALAWVKQYSDSLKERLDGGKSYKMGNLGVFSKIGEDYIFEPESGLNLLDDAFAFSALKEVKTFDDADAYNQIKPIVTKENVIEQKTEIVVENREEIVVNVSEEDNAFLQQKKERIAEVLNEVLEKKEELQQEREINEVKVEISSEKEVVFESSINDVERSDEELAMAQKEVEERLENIKKEKEESKEREYTLENIQKKHHKDKKRRKKKNKFLLFLLWFFSTIIVLCGGFIGAHYMGWLKDIELLKPITERLNMYIMPIDNNEEIKVSLNTTPAISTQTQTQTATEITPVIVEKSDSKVNKKTQTSSDKAKEQKKQKVEKPQKIKTNPDGTVFEPSATIDYTTPIEVNNSSKLGFDVVGGTFSSRDNANQAVRKARSMGYDAYIVSRQKNEKPIYYVSYGSRRTLNEANDLMQKITKRLGSDFYIISR